VTTITFQAEDSKGNKETGGGLTVAFSLGSTKGGQGTFGSVVDHGNGTYTATFTGTIAGSNTITATIDGTKVTSAASAVKVVPGLVSPAASTVSISSATVKAGTAITVTLQARDAAGNKETAGGQQVLFYLGNGGGTGTFSVVKDNKNGTYTATFTGTLAGTNTVIATINGQAVTSTAPAIAVTPGAAGLAKSVVTLSSGTVMAGGTLTVTLRAVDLDGNPESSGGLAVAFKLGSTKGGQGTFGKVTDNKNGTYTATFTGTIAGSNTIAATIGGKAVTTAAPPVMVTPGAMSLAKSVVLLSTTSVKVGSNITVTLQAVDAYGNKLTEGGLIIAFALANTTGGQGTFGSVNDNHNGTYTATFTGTTTGSNVILASINTQALSSKPAVIKIM
jgi:adhesin/invasin